MELGKSTLPWSGVPVWRSEELHACLGERLPQWENYLPASITLFVDLDVPTSAAEQLLEDITTYLRLEFERRTRRNERFVELRLLGAGEIESFLTARTHVQPWAIYYSKSGGLGGAEDLFRAGAVQGVIPCSSMRNHGVAWERSADGTVRSWLATSRRPHQAWDWESDIGHESAHAAFAHVPLFVQSSPRIPDNLLSSTRDVNELSPLHVAQMMYLWSELAVVAVRGEPRPTATGLPVASASELEALLRLSGMVSGDVDFETAAKICAATEGRIDVNHGDDIFQIAAPVLRVLPLATVFVNDLQPPTAAMLQDALAVAR